MMIESGLFFDILSQKCCLSIKQTVFMFLRQVYYARGQQHNVNHYEDSCGHRIYVTTERLFRGRFGSIVDPYLTAPEMWLRSEARLAR